MVYDFGLMKQGMKELIDSFDHAIALWDGDDAEYISDMKKHSSVGCSSPSLLAEQFSRVIFVMIDKLLWFTKRSMVKRWYDSAVLSSMRQRRIRTMFS